MGTGIWHQCLAKLVEEIDSEQFDTYLKPLQVRVEDSAVALMAPNIYVEEQVRDVYLQRIQELFGKYSGLDEALDISLTVGDLDSSTAGEPLRADGTGRSKPSHNLNSEFSFDTFVEGKSNELAKAAASQVAENDGTSYNPLLLYGGVGLGTTHLMQAVGNEILKRKPDARVVYLHSQRFVQDMVKALQQVDDAFEIGIDANVGFLEHLAVDETNHLQAVFVVD